MTTAASHALERFRTAFEELVGAFNPAALAPAERGDALALLARVEKTAATAGAMTASLMTNERGEPFEHVPPMKVGQMTSRCSGLWGVTAARAYRAIESGSRLIKHARLRDAALAGEISLTQAHLVAEAAESDSSSVDFLLKSARLRNVAGLAVQCRRVKSMSQPAPPSGTANASLGTTTEMPQPPTGEKFHKRYLRSWFDSNGQWHLEAAGSREDGERVNAALARFLPAPTPAPKVPLCEEPEPRSLVALLALAEAAEVAGLGADDWEEDFLSVAGHRPKQVPGKGRPRYRLPKPKPFRLPEFPLDCLDWLHKAMAEEAAVLHLDDEEELDDEVTPPRLV